MLCPKCGSGASKITWREEMGRQRVCEDCNFIFDERFDMTELDNETRLKIQQTIVMEAMKLLDIPYMWGAEWVDLTKKPDFLDCSETVEGPYKIVRLSMPDGAQNQYNHTVTIGMPRIGDLAFMGREKGNPFKIYHSGIVVDDHQILECRAFDPKASFPTGKVILRPRVKWEQWVNFAGYRAHPRLI